MNRKQFTLLLVLVLIIGGAGLVVYKSNSSSWEGGGKAPGGKILGDFALNDVARVVIQTGDTTLTLAKKNDLWVVQERDDYPADFARVGNFIQGLWQLKPVQQEKIGPSQLGRVGLMLPAKGAVNAATRIELQNGDSKRIVALLAGKKFLKKSAQYPGEEGFPAGRYVMPADATPPSVSLVSETLEQADPVPAAWLDKSFLHIDKIKSVAVVSGSIQWIMNRDSETATDWKLAGIQPNEKLDPAKVPSFAGILGSPTFNDVLATSAKRDGFEKTVTVETFDGFTYTLKFGKSEGDNISLSVAVAANLPKERAPGKDEKPEDKKRLDEEFAATVKQLNETLAKAKALEQRLYLVPKTSFDALFKSRAELLAEEKKPEPAATPATSVAAPVPASTAPAGVTP